MRIPFLLTAILLAARPTVCVPAPQNDDPSSSADPEPDPQPTPSTIGYPEDPQPTWYIPYGCPQLIYFVSGQGICRCRYEQPTCGNLNGSAHIIPLGAGYDMQKCADACDNRITCSGYYIGGRGAEAGHCNIVLGDQVHGSFDPDYDYGTRDAWSCLNPVCDVATSNGRTPSIS